MSLMHPVLAFCLLLNVSVAFAELVHTPKKGSAERQQIRDAARVKVATDLAYRDSILFDVRMLRVAEGWALLQAQPVTKSGAPLHIRCIEADEITLVLLQFRDGAWHVIRGGTTCATDVFWLVWQEELGVPAQLFELKAD
jgi:hypothetical protein